MVKQKGGNRTIIISIFVILAIVGIVVGVLFATGVLGKKTSSSGSGAKPTPPGPKPSPLGPNVPNPYSGPVIETTLSNPVLSGTSGPGGGINSGVTYNVSYNPGGGFPPVVPWTLVTTALLTFADGSTDTVTQKDPGISYINTISWQPFGGGLGMNRNPVHANISAYISYQNESGNTINGPVSNTLSVPVPAIN